MTYPAALHPLYYQLNGFNLLATLFAAFNGAASAEPTTGMCERELLIPAASLIGALVASFETEVTALPATGMCCNTVPGLATRITVAVTLCDGVGGGLL